METTFLSSSLNLPHRQPLFFYPSNQRTKRILLKKILGAKRGESEGNHEGKSPVDESMIVLQMRIKKMKALEVASRERVTPSSDSKEWEKKLFTLRHENVYDTIEILQSYLLKTKPSVALGILLALFAMCVPLSSPDAVVNVLKVVKELLAGCHVCIDIHF